MMAAVDHAPGPFAGSENTLNKDIMMVANSLAEISTREGNLLQCWLQPMEGRLQRSSASTEEEIHCRFHKKTDAPSIGRGIICWQTNSSSVRNH